MMPATIGHQTTKSRTIYGKNEKTAECMECEKWIQNMRIGISGNATSQTMTIQAF
jgi:hypothetical protein